MRVEYWSYSGVKPDGTLRGDTGSVRVAPEVSVSGNHWTQTPSVKADGLWMSVSTGRLPDETLHGITLYFADEAEMAEFEQSRVWSPA